MVPLLRQWRVDQRLTPAELLALEEILLTRLNENPRPADAHPWFFFAECAPAVVLGTGQKHAQEIHRQACDQDGLPVLRRPSGGGCVLHLPGMLWFSLGVPFEWLPQGAGGGIRATFQDVLTPFCAVLKDLYGLDAALQGISDLAVPAGVGEIGPAGVWRKVAGSAQCRKQRAVLTHGTLLIKADLRRLPVYLQEPEKQPDYRAKRSHLDFVANLQMLAPHLQIHPLLDAFERAWIRMLTPQAGAIEITPADPTSDDRAAIAALVASKYHQEEWTYRL